MSNNLYRLDVQPLGMEYGYFIPSGTNKVRICDDQCPIGCFRLIYPDPRVFEYTGGRLGDFMSAIGRTIVRKEIGIELAKHLKGIELKPFHVAYPPGIKGKALEEIYREIRPILDIPANPGRSTFLPPTHCTKCGRTSYELTGMEEDPKEEKIGDQWEPVPRKPRRPGNGILLTGEEIGGNDCFAFLGFLICNERAKQRIESADYTNVRFREYGEIIPK